MADPLSVISGDISPLFVFKESDREIINELLKHEETPEAIKLFLKLSDELTDYSYWFILSVLWVSYTGYSNLDDWKRCFLSSRPGRRLSIMKPSELKEFNNLPDAFTVYRTHRDGETDWISYTTKLYLAAKMALARGTNFVTEYKIRKKHCIAYFLRRNEFEIISLKKEFIKKIANVEVKYA